MLEINTNLTFLHEMHLLSAAKATVQSNHVSSKFHRILYHNLINCSSEAHQRCSIEICQ